MLTQNGAGDINASFVSTKTLGQCQQKASMLEGVFAVSKIPVVERRCIQSNLKFSKFGHASASSKIRNFYLVKFDDNSVQVNKVQDWKTCMMQAKQEVERAGVYCSSSVQALEN